MGLFDDENVIIEHFQSESISSVMLIPHCDDTESVFHSIFDKRKWKLWTDTSGKNDPPPDFFSDELGLMMDVMRVDDHSFIGKKGKLVNPTLARESIVEKELRDSGIMALFPNTKLCLNVDTKLPTEEDHNYKFYRDNFIRTVTAHKGKISNYKANHPGHKIIFFVFDESSAYMQVPLKIVQPEEGQITPGQLHFWFWDKAFLDVIKGSEIDYLIWHTPNKLIRAVDYGILDLPKVVVIKTDKLPQKQQVYDEIYMMSSEI